MPLNRSPVATGHVLLNRWLWVLGLAVLALVAALVLSSTDGPVSPAVVSAPAQNPPQVGAVPQATVDAQPARTTVRTPRGRVTCPQGATPTVSIGFTKFRPHLLNGTHFRRGVTYHVLLRGWAVNETTAPITISRIITRVGTQTWPTVRRNPPALNANSKGAVRIRGALHSTSRDQVHLEALLRWHWTAKQLRRCGDRGLIDDD